MKFFTTFSALILFLKVTPSISQTQLDSIQFKNPYLFNSEIEKKLKEDTLAWKHQISAANYASKGDTKNALKNWSKAFGSANGSFTNLQIDSLRSNFRIIPAKEYIVQQASEHKVIIINEAHHYAPHRVFTESLLRELYENGYKNLGVEALSNGNNIDAELNERKYPIQGSGYYIKDPNFGNLLRTALNIGYNVFAYDQTSNVNGKEREIAQARNIEKKIQEKPDEKFLIFCGFEHALEGAHKSWEKAMAGRLKEYTGIDPLTINQVKYSERSDPANNEPLLKALQVEQPSILLDLKNDPLQYEKDKGWSDIAILHPNTSNKKGRPQWLIQDDKELVQFENEKIEITYPIMALAYKKDENIKNAIPFDIIELQNKSDKSFFVLEKGTYNIVVSNKDNHSFIYELKVK